MSYQFLIIFISSLTIDDNLNNFLGSATFTQLFIFNIPKLKKFFIFSIKSFKARRNPLRSLLSMEAATSDSPDASNVSPKVEVKLTKDEYFKVKKNRDVSFCVSSYRFIYSCS